jgi:hypothetical protein
MLMQLIFTFCILWFRCRLDVYIHLLGVFLWNVAAVFSHAFEMPCHPTPVLSRIWNAIWFLKCHPILNWTVEVPLHLHAQVLYEFQFQFLCCFNHVQISIPPQSSTLWPNLMVFFSCWATFPPTSFFLVLVNLCYFLVPLKTNRFLMFSPFRLSSVSFIVAHGGIVYSDFHLVLLTLLFISFIPVSQ